MLQIVHHNGVGRKTILRQALLMECNTRAKIREKMTEHSLLDKPVSSLIKLTDYVSS